MKFGVLAFDYDGTIARDGVLSSDVKAAITEARYPQDPAEYFLICEVS
jgi:hydroxymethylpyrimidine pyrophosphatase-like HAD family hydrolase